MAEEVEMTPVTAAEPPKVNPLATAAAPKLKPGLKLPPQSGLKPGLKLPPKPGATVSAVRPGLKLPTQNALKPGIKLPPKPVIRKPGTGVSVAPLPKPVAPAAAAKPAEPVAAPAKPVAPVAAAPVAAAPAAKPVAVDAQGVEKLPTVEAKAVARDAVTPVASANLKPMEALKSVTQKLKGVTQEIPQQAILHKTGIIAEGAMTDAQKEAAKHKTARISLSDAMGVAPVKNESAPMKTIRIKRPISIPGATTPLKPQPEAAPAAEAAPAPVAAPAAETAAAEAEPSASITQRKTLKIARPGAVRPAGKFGIKRPSQATTVATQASAADGAAPAPAADGAVADIADIPALPTAIAPAEKAPASDGPAWLWTLSSLVQIAACVAMGALAWFLYQNTQISYF